MHHKISHDLKPSASPAPRHWTQAVVKRSAPLVGVAYRAAAQELLGDYHHRLAELHAENLRQFRAMALWDRLQEPPRTTPLTRNHRVNGVVVSRRSRYGAGYRASIVRADPVRYLLTTPTPTLARAFRPTSNLIWQSPS